MPRYHLLRVFMGSTNLMQLGLAFRSGWYDRPFSVCNAADYPSSEQRHGNVETEMQMADNFEYII